MLKLKDSRKNVINYCKFCSDFSKSGFFLHQSKKPNHFSIIEQLKKGQMAASFQPLIRTKAVIDSFRH